jgi:cytochrome c biogenesis protein CcmG, thiol:disulfide interchange protein DsbE
VTNPTGTSDDTERDAPEPTLAQSEAEDEGRIGYGRYARYSPLALALAMILLLGGIGYWQTRPDEPDAPWGSTSALTGKPVPAVTLTTFEGNTIDFSQLTGSVVVVNFWAEWCAPCRAEMPAFQEVYEQTRLTGEPVVFVGVNLKSDYVENARKLIDELGITYIAGRDSAGDDPRRGEIELAFGVPASYPVTVFVRPDGVIDTFRIGGPDVSRFSRGRSAADLVVRGERCRQCATLGADPVPHLRSALGSGHRARVDVRAGRLGREGADVGALGRLSAEVAGRRAPVTVVVLDGAGRHAGRLPAGLPASLDEGILPHLRGVDRLLGGDARRRDRDHARREHERRHHAQDHPPHPRPRPHRRSLSFVAFRPSVR